MNKIKIKLIVLVILTISILGIFSSKAFAYTYYHKDGNNNIFIFNPGHLDEVTSEFTEMTSLSVIVYETGNKINYSWTNVNWTFTLYGEGENARGIPATLSYRDLVDNWSWDDTMPKVPPKPDSQARDKREGIDVQTVVDDANGFLQKGQESQIPEETIQNISDTIYSTLLIIGILLAVIVGMGLGIKFITSGIEGKAEVKQILLPYGIGVVVLFGAFAIWKIVLTILQN